MRRFRLNDWKAEVVTHRLTVTDVGSCVAGRVREEEEEDEDEGEEQEQQERWEGEEEEEVVETEEEEESHTAGQEDQHRRQSN